MSDRPFLGEPLPAYTYRNATVTDGELVCCLCGQEIGRGMIAEQWFETDPTGEPFVAHATCAYSYNLALRAFQMASGL